MKSHMWVMERPDLNIFNFSLHTQDFSVEKGAYDLSYIQCEIIFDCRGQGNYQPFQVRGSLIAFQEIPSPGTRNGVNPVDVDISVGNPVINPVAGSIQYVTNRYLNPVIRGARDTTRVDYAWVSSTASSVTVYIDTSTAAAN
ncbi:hypothetical protein MRS44_017131 [Fusarium solani]|nr:hypothetical protein MRS44_017131 [Fusarium solani]